MKKFLFDLIGTEVICLVAVPLTIIGMCTGAVIYDKKVEPWINKKLGE